VSASCFALVASETNLVLGFGWLSFRIVISLRRRVVSCSYAVVTKHHSGNQVKKTEMGRTCGTYGGEERCIQGFSGET
jgi:hypothetical protein